MLLTTHPTPIYPRAPYPEAAGQLSKIGKLQAKGVNNRMK
jgi:hypothetical protein